MRGLNSSHGRRALASIADTLPWRANLQRAKGILMKSQGLSEAEALRRIQKMSMDKRMPLREVTGATILAHEAQGNRG